MNTLRALLLSAAALALPVVAGESTDLRLNTNEILKNAKIVAIGEKSVTIVHAGGATAVPVDDVPLDVLARAHMALQERGKALSEQDRQILELEVKRSDREKMSEERGKEAVALQTRLDSVTIDAIIKVISVTKTGVVASGHGTTRRTVVRTRPRSKIIQGTGLNAHLKERHTWTESSVEPVRAALPETFFVKMNTTGLTDGASVRVTMWRLHQPFAYNSAGNARVTVATFTTDRGEFLASSAGRAFRD